MNIYPFAVFVCSLFAKFLIDKFGAWVNSSRCPMFKYYVKATNMDYYSDNHKLVKFQVANFNRAYSLLCFIPAYLDMGRLALTFGLILNYIHESVGLHGLIISASVILIIVCSRRLSL